jgi:hypothetical protein
MKEHPILFSGPMVRAILEGSKTQTRRVVKPQPGNNFLSFGDLPTCTCHPFGFHDGERHWSSPYGAPGGQLWVRETWRKRAGLYYYAADFAPDDVAALKWKPSIHMRREASRLALEVTEIRVERLQAISEEDASAEGVHRIKGAGGAVYPGTGAYRRPGSYRHAFQAIWEQINVKRTPWSSNPWVWVVSFRKMGGAE